MFAVSVIALVSLLVFGLANATQKAESLRHSVAEQLRTRLAQDLHQAIVDYRKISVDYPAGVEVLDPAYSRNLGAVTSGSVAYKIGSASFANSDWHDVKRAVVFATRSGLNSKLQTDEIFKGNSCDTATDWQTAAAWCPKSGVALYSAVLDPRPVMAREIAAQRERLSRTLHRLASFYNGTRTFPTHGAKGEEINVGERSDSDLSDIAFDAAALAAGRCKSGSDQPMLYYGAYSPDEKTKRPALPLGCEDVFDVWGQGVRYQRPDRNSVRLVAVAPYKNKDKPTDPILIVQELNLNE